MSTHAEGAEPVEGGEAVEGAEAVEGTEAVEGAEAVEGRATKRRAPLAIARKASIQKSQELATRRQALEAAAAPPLARAAAAARTRNLLHGKRAAMAAATHAAESVAMSHCLATQGTGTARPKALGPTTGQPDLYERALFEAHVPKH